MANVPSVWIVTSGSYSDYRIVAVFSTEAEAKAFVNGCEVAGIEEWSLGPPPDGGLYQKTFYALLDLRTGNGAKDWGKYGWETREEMHPRDWSFAYPSYYFTHGIPGTTKGVAGASVVSQEHAVKVAAEFQQNYLRENKEAGESSK